MLVGYLGVLMGTSVGQGWRLLAHTAATTHAELEAPKLQSEPLLTPAPGMTTLREPTHSHSGHTHRHSALPEADRHVRTGATAQETPREETFHAHGTEVHSHDLPAPEDAPVALVTLDDHRLPLSTGLVAPAPRDSPRLGDSSGRLVSALITVETPPPRA